MNARSVAAVAAVVLASLLGLGALVRPWYVVRRSALLRVSGEPWPDVAAGIWALRSASVLNRVAPFSLLIVLRPWLPHPSIGRWAAAGIVIVLVGVLLAVNNAHATTRLLDAEPADRPVANGIVEVLATPGWSLVPLAWWSIAGGSVWRAVGIIVALVLTQATAIRSAPSILRAAGLLSDLPRSAGLTPIVGERLGLLRSPIAAAVGFGWGREVVVTTALQRTLSAEQLRAVQHHEAHQLVHGRRRAWQEMLFRSAAVACFASLPRPALLFVLASVGVPVVVLAARWSRAGEVGVHRSDEPSDGRNVYGQALVRMHERGLLPVDVAIPPHPSLDQRLRSIGVEPDYARPRRSAARGLRVIRLAGLVVFGAAVALMTVLDVSR